MRSATFSCMILIVVCFASQADAQLFRGRRVIRQGNNCAGCNPATTTVSRQAPAKARPVNRGYQTTNQVAQPSPDTPEVNEAEVLRMGDTVQHIDGLHRSTPDDAYIEAMGTPESDADKWFVSVLSMRGCAACQKLKQEWVTNPWLLALANPKDPKRSWAHYNTYLREDASQAWRFKNITVTAYPTVVIQPPRSGKYGNPETVVFQGTYGGDSKSPASKITQAIRLYVSKLPRCHMRDGGDLQGGPFCAQTRHR